MRSILSRFRRPYIAGLPEQLMLMNSTGDGSTLTLDFTTGVLDPRLTFTRASNATFINSGGLVQWAASNHAPRTNWNFTSPTGSGWNAATTSGTGTFQWVGDGTVIASSGSSGQAFTIITSPTGIAEGLRYVMSVTAQSVTGSPTIQSIFDFTGASGNTYFKNGATATAGTTVASGDRISVSAVATATTMNVRMGCGAWFANRTNESVTLTKFHWHPGSSPVPYYENTATSPRYDSARFDHDPTTLAPRGLLIEGTATNLLQQSADWTVSPWSKPAQITWDGTTYATAPDGTTSAKQITVTGGASASISQGVTTGTNRTISLWIRAGSLTSFSVGAFDSAGTTWGNNADSTCSIISGPGNAPVQQIGGLWSITGLSTTQWTRVQIFRSTTYTNLLAYPGSSSGTINGTAYVWGMQMEAGNGASSLIPTGASQGTRNADHCTMPTSSFITGPLYPQTLFVECIPATPSAAFPDIVRLFDRTAGGTFNYGNEIYYFSAATMSVQRKINSSSGTDRALASGLTYNTRHKFATSIDSSSFLGSYDGLTGSGATTAAAALASQVTHLGVGCNGDATPVSVMFGTVRQIKFFPFAMAQSQLNTLTTL